VQLLHWGFWTPHASESLHALQVPPLQTIPGGHCDLQTISYPTQIPFSHFCPGKQCVHLLRHIPFMQGLQKAEHFGNGLLQIPNAQSDFSLGQSSSVMHSIGWHISLKQNSPTVQLEHGLGEMQIFDTEQISPGLQSVFSEQGGLHELSTQVSSLLQSVLRSQVLLGKHISPFTNSKGSGHITVVMGGLLHIPLSQIVGKAQSELRSQANGG
jgi:hypothetical protein